MRTRTIARWRRAALGTALAVGLAMPVRAEDKKPAPDPEQARAAAPEQTPAAAPEQTPAAAPEQSQAPAGEQATSQDASSKKPVTGETAPLATEQSARPPPDGNIQPVPGTPEEYTIQKGDTLWDLSQKFLSNPWYWPKIWSQNPAIENPHWIYPGNKLRIIPGQGGPQAPAQVAAEETPAEQPQTAAEPPIPSNQRPDSVDISQAATPDVDVVSRSSKENQAALSTVSVTGKLAFTPPPVVTVRTSGLVSAEELSQAGSIAASFEEREMLSTYDTAYVRFHGEVPAKPGDKLVLFRPDGDIVHPVSHRKLAAKTQNVGIVKVIDVRGDLATVQVEQVFEEIARGDLVRPWTPPTVRVAPKPNTQEVKGVVVSAVDNAGLSTYGEANQVFVDKGSADGVQEGNTFAVVRRGDGLNAKVVTGHTELAGEAGRRAAKIATPDENVGLLLVVETKEHLSTALVIKSIRELDPGDEVEMHPSGAGGGGP